MYRGNLKESNKLGIHFPHRTFFGRARFVLGKFDCNWNKTAYMDELRFMVLLKLCVLTNQLHFPLEVGLPSIRPRPSAGFSGRRKVPERPPERPSPAEPLSGFWPGSRGCPACAPSSASASPWPFPSAGASRSSAGVVRDSLSLVTC